MFFTLMDCNSGDLASKDRIYKILTRETSMVSITLLGSIFRIKENTASLISARISCSLEAPALMTAARTCNISNYHPKKTREEFGINTKLLLYQEENKRVSNGKFSARAIKRFNCKCILKMFMHTPIGQLNWTDISNDLP